MTHHPVWMSHHPVGPDRTSTAHWGRYDGRSWVTRSHTRAHDIWVRNKHTGVRNRHTKLQTQNFAESATVTQQHETVHVLKEQGHRDSRAVTRDGVPHQVERHALSKSSSTTLATQSIVHNHGRGKVGWNAGFHGWKSQNQGEHNARDAHVVFGVHGSTQDDTDDPLSSRVVAWTILVPDVLVSSEKKHLPIVICGHDDDKIITTPRFAQQLLLFTVVTVVVTGSTLCFFIVSLSLSLFGTRPWVGTRCLPADSFRVKAASRRRLAHSLCPKPPSRLHDTPPTWRHARARATSPCSQQSRVGLVMSWPSDLNIFLSPQCV